jgi:quercetin dioxygenase-like cupin family protein
MKAIDGGAVPRNTADDNTFVLPAFVQTLLGRGDELPLRIYRVAFGEGSRMNWHHHDDIQVLFGLSGTCVVVNRDGAETLLSPGDMVVVEPGEEHWHGAAPGAEGEHLAINMGTDTTWLEPVS